MGARRARRGVVMVLRVGGVSVAREGTPGTTIGAGVEGEAAGCMTGETAGSALDTSASGCVAATGAATATAFVDPTVAGWTMSADENASLSAAVTSAFATSTACTSPTRT